MPRPLCLVAIQIVINRQNKNIRLTRRMLEVCNEFNQPVGILTKNSWILKDKDVLQEMAKKIVSAMVSITSFNEDLRRVMEPRTTTAKQKLKVIKELSNAGVRMGIMMGPMIPGLNEHEMQRIMKAAKDNGATFTAYTFIRLNGAIKFLFHDWLYKNFPDRADKVWHLIEASHDGKVNDTRWGVRMRGEGNIAQMVAQQYKKYGKLYGMNAEDGSWIRVFLEGRGSRGGCFDIMFYVISYYLNELIVDSIHGSIDLHRQSKNTIYFDGDDFVAFREIYDFISSSPYFSHDLKEFLYSRDYSVFIGVTKEWFYEFIDKIYLWAESEEWLSYDAKYICDPLLNESPERKRLDLSSNNKAIFYCQRNFF